MTRPSLALQGPLARAPSITRLFLATFFAVALAGSTIALTAWLDARRTERSTMAILSTLDRLHTINPDPALEADRNRIRTLAEDLNDQAQQAALATTIILVAVLASLGIGLVYSRRRLAEPFVESDELTRLNEELAKANRLKSDFLANMSHELRTPLNSIIGFSDMLLTEEVGSLTAMQQDFLETVARNGRHLLQLISELLNLSKIESGNLELTPETLDLRDLVREAADSVRAQTDQRRQTLSLDVPPHPLLIPADRVRVRQVLLNLLSNAIKFTPENGQVRVSARPADGDVRIEVVDTGIGIAPEDQSRLFKEFTQLDPSASRHYEGTGLGLALCRRLVELHGGRIGCDSARGRGSTFWFTLPRERPARGRTMQVPPLGVS